MGDGEGSGDEEGLKVDDGEIAGEAMATVARTEVKRMENCILSFGFRRA